MATWNVRKDGSGTHTEIQSAIYDAAEGDIVDVGVGTFNENVDMYKGVTLQGAGKEQTIVQGSSESAAVGSYTCVLGSNVLSFPNGTSLMRRGRLITGTAIPANARIVSIQANSITISANATATRATLTVASMPIIEGTIRIRGSGGTIKNMKVVGWDINNPGIEASAVYYRRDANGSVGATNQILEDCWIVANGEYAILTEFNASVNNITIRNNRITGKTFVGDNPASGDQFSVMNVPRQLVAIQSVNTNCSFTGNMVEGITGGVTLAGVNSYNTAVTIDAPAAVIHGNSIKGVHGYGFAIRARGVGASLQNNVVYAFGQYASSGYSTVSSWANAKAYAVDDLALKSQSGKTGLWRCVQAHTSSSVIDPTLAGGAAYWVEQAYLTQEGQSLITGLGKAYYSTAFGVGNVSIDKGLVDSEQAAPGAPVSVEMSVNLVKSIPKVDSDPVFSDEANWNLVTFVYKKQGGSQRLVATFKGFSAAKEMKLKAGMQSGNRFELVKVIISRPDRSLLVMRRSKGEIPDAESFDFQLA